MEEEDGEDSTVAFAFGRRGVRRGKQAFGLSIGERRGLSLVRAFLGLRYALDGVVGEGVGFAEMIEQIGQSAVLILAGNCCPPNGSSLAEAWDPSRILPPKQRTGGVVPEVLNRPAIGCDPFGIRSVIGQRTVELRAAKASSAPNPEGSKPVAPG